MFGVGGGTGMKIVNEKRNAQLVKRERGKKDVPCGMQQPETGRRAWANFHMRCCEIVTPW